MTCRRPFLLILALVAAGCGGPRSPSERTLGAEDVDSLRQGLIERGERDQYYRGLDYGTMDDSTRGRLFAEGTATDSANTAWLKEVVAAVGWPDSTRFGAEAARAAFLLVQHADRDPDFQAEMLPLLGEAAERKEIDAKQLAYLTDRVRVKQSLPQVYGTQYSADTLPDGSVIADDEGHLHYLLPIVEDIEHLDDRRAAVGLDPWWEYEARMARLHERPAADRPRAEGE